MDKQLSKSNTLVRLLGIGATAFICGYSVAVGSMKHSNPDITIESTFINNDNEPDFVIVDNKRGNYFALLSNQNSTYEKCDVVGDSKVFSKRDKRFYAINK